MGQRQGTGNGGRRLLAELSAVAPAERRGSLLAIGAAVAEVAEMAEVGTNTGEAAGGGGAAAVVVGCSDGCCSSSESRGMNGWVFVAWGRGGRAQPAERWRATTRRRGSCREQAWALGTGTLETCGSCAWLLPLTTTWPMRKGLVGPYVPCVPAGCAPQHSLRESESEAEASSGRCWMGLPAPSIVANQQTSRS